MFTPLKTCGRYIYHQFIIQQFYVLPTQCIFVFCVDQRTGIFSNFNINRLAFIKIFICLKLSGHYVYQQFNIHQFYVLPTQCNFVFSVDLSTAFYSPFNIIRLVLITAIYPFKAQWSLYVPTVLHSSILRSAHTV